MPDGQTAHPRDAEGERARARQLAAAGRYLDAIAVGRDVNRQHPDAGFERDLRDWRHHAFYEAKRAPGRTDWPPSYADPFPSVIDQVPEIDATALSARILGGALHHHGSLILRNFLPPARAAQCARDIDRAFQARTDVGGPGQSDYAPLEPANGADLNNDRAFVSEMSVLLVDAPHFLAGWLEDVESTGVLDAVTEYLGERPAISASKGTLYRLPPEGGGQWHQDGAFLGKDIRTVNLWVAASDCGVDAPGLDIVPWRLDGIVPTGTHGTYFDWSVGHGMVEELASGRSLATPHFKAGDAILFDQLCLHRTGGAPHMTRGRYAIETWMFAPSHYNDGVLLVI